MSEDWRKPPPPIMLYGDADGTTWRIVEHEGRKITHVTIFTGPDAETRAKEYVKWLEDCGELLG